jgi:2-methylcitrate dehydratase PrpD
MPAYSSERRFVGSTVDMSASTVDGGAVGRLGDFAHSVNYGDLLPDDQVRTKLRLLNVVGSVLAARGLVATQLALSYAHRLPSSGASSYWLADKCGSAEDVAFVNGMLAHIALLDDTVTHTGTMLVPAALAVAEEHQCSGEDVLAALAVGYEITARIEAGLMLASAVTLKGFRHSWPGAFGAAAAAAKLMGLSAEGIADALSLISTLAVPGTMAWYCNWSDEADAARLGEVGTTERYVQLGANAKNAVVAATLAAHGFHGSKVALEGECGIYSVYSNGMGMPPEMFHQLGNDWHLAAIGVKPYPGSWVIPIYCAEEIARQHPFTSVSEVAEVNVEMVTWKRNLAVIYPGPFTNQEQALVSAPFNVAATLIFGKYDVGVLARAVGDPRVDELAAKINITALPGSVTPEAKAGVVELVLTDGTSFREDASSMPVQRLRPDTWAEMSARYEGMTPDDNGANKHALAEFVKTFEDSSANGLADLLRTS